MYRLHHWDLLTDLSGRRSLLLVFLSCLWWEFSESIQLGHRTQLFAQTLFLYLPIMELLGDISIGSAHHLFVGPRKTKAPSFQSLSPRFRGNSSSPSCPAVCLDLDTTPLPCPQLPWASPSDSALMKLLPIVLFLLETDPESLLG